MKIKKLLITLALLMGIMSTHAQNWRGFLEIYSGTSPSKSLIEYQKVSCYDMWNALSFGLNYTMGAAVIPQLYAGIGIGGYTTFLSYRESGSHYYDSTFYALYFPVFANIRWIPDITKKINPFVDLKIGYQMGVDLDDNRLWVGHYDDYYEYYEYYARHRNGVFLQPGVGLRFGRESAFNLGVAYNVCIPQDFVRRDKMRPGNPVSESIKKNYGSIILTFGADF